VLALGLGAGAHRAALVIAQSTRSTTSTGGWRKYPERSTHHLCRGTLPGGLDGVVAHQLHLRQGGGEDGKSWQAMPHTVVVAQLPEGARVACELSGRAAEDLAPVDGPELRTALAGAAGRTLIEYRYGTLCVSAPGALTEGAALDGLCRVAAAFAAGMARAAAALPTLDAAPLPAPPARPALDAGVARVAWHAPPGGVAEAEAAYASALAAEAAATGRSVRRLTLLVGVVFGALVLSACLALATLAAGTRVGVALFLLVFGPPYVWRLARAAYRAKREEAAAYVGARALPWGIEAFARGYAQARGLALEDPGAFRRRFAAPLPGLPLAVLRGEGVRLVLWADPSDLAGTRHHLVAVGARTVVRAVDARAWSAAQLDALAAEASAVPLAA
jgi:hypothetical protein